MPIPRKNRALYGSAWHAVSHRIRFERAQGQCECQGVCGIDHAGRGRCEERHAHDAINFSGRVVLTVAHLDHDPRNSVETNLAALCQRCHLRLDREQHATNARCSRERKAGQSRLFLG